VARVVAAPRERVYAALLDPAGWRFPTGMTCVVHELDARVGGAIRVSLTYDAPDAAGKTSAHTDTYRGRFVELVPNERVVEVDEFDTDDPAFAGAMTATFELADVAGGTEVVGTHEGVPEGVSLEDNRAGWEQALARLAELVES
jgi:uncharacterized protein YndB with AHSA1/START domain